MSNSYHTAPVFKNDVPVTSASGHGIGIQSMISVIEKYHGIYGFLPKMESSVFRHQSDRTIQLTPVFQLVLMGISLHLLLKGRKLSFIFSGGFLL